MKSRPKSKLSQLGLGVEQVFTPPPPPPLSLNSAEPVHGLLRVFRSNGDFTIRRRDGNENVQNNNRFSRQNNNYARAPHFFVHFFAVFFARLRRKIA